MQARSPKLLELHAPYAKLLLRATHELMKQPQYTYEGPAYRSPPICCSCWWHCCIARAYLCRRRGLKIALNAELKQKFDTYCTATPNITTDFAFCLTLEQQVQEQLRCGLPHDLPRIHQRVA